MRAPTARTRPQITALWRSWTPFQQSLYQEGLEDSRACRMREIDAENWSADVIESLSSHGITEAKHVTGLGRDPAREAVAKLLEGL